MNTPAPTPGRLYLVPAPLDFGCEPQAPLRDALPDGAVEKAFTISLSEGQAALEADVELSDSLTNAVSSCAS